MHLPDYKQPDASLLTPLPTTVKRQASGMPLRVSNAEVVLLPGHAAPTPQGAGGTAQPPAAELSAGCAALLLAALL